MNDWNDLIGPAVVAAFVSAAVSIAMGLVNRATTLSLHRKKVNADIALAKMKFDYDRKQAVFKRRFEVAEQFLADAYRFKTMMKYARNGVAFGDEGSTRKTLQNETEDQKEIRNTYFVPLERINKNNEFISNMMSRRFTCYAHFGLKANEAYDHIDLALNRLVASASMLINWGGKDGGLKIEMLQKLEADIWEPMAEARESNGIGEDIESAIKIIENLSIPVLEWVDDVN
ncbi:MAG: hypothetical protein EON60_05585 [Alphaproteobacteria bacterium]|nr:MAG: hypothetical protein EON60_05585 [Alphaproteobacteria bacterium]